MRDIQQLRICLGIGTTRVAVSGPPGKEELNHPECSVSWQWFAWSAGQKATVEKKVADLREAMKMEKAAEITIRGEKAPHTREVVSIFLNQLRGTYLQDKAESSGSLKEQLMMERMERESLQKRLVEMEQQLARATSGRKR